MAEDIAISAESLSKKYIIGSTKNESFRESIMSVFSQKKTKTEEFWALKDIDFTIKKGETIGIIGRNGAGKSTLLKVLSRITEPTTGIIKIHGRVSSLLEVGTGFHPELTGKENIYLNGTILGMSRKEVKLKFDEIVDFSGIEKFLNTPVKHYSSGMYVRLAFAVAAHLEPEILIIDEVLAVGDTEFQKKCLGKMEDVAHEGRTVIFVSHSLPSLKSICKKGILLESGRITKTGQINEVIESYINSYESSQNIAESIHYFQEVLKVHEVLINNSPRAAVTIENDELVILIDIELIKKTPFELDIHLKKNEVFVASFANFVRRDPIILDKGRHQVEYHIVLPEMRSGKYILDLYFTEPFSSWFARVENSISLEIINSQCHTFLNPPAFNWGAILLDGSMKKI